MDEIEQKTTTPKSAGIATTNSSNFRTLLNIYIDFLAVTGKLKDSTSFYETPSESSTSNMAAIFDSSNPASPLAYNASQTALLLLDFQGFIVERCGLAGLGALAKGTAMRNWAFAHKVMVIHSVVDITGKPSAICKGAERITKMLEGIANDRDSAEEPSEISFGKNEGEYIVLKYPGHVSALKSAGAMELLREHGIKSLILCGISTSGAILRTAMPATDEGFVVSVIQDGCCDPNETVHNVLLESVLPSRAHVATAEEFMAEWARAVI